MKEYKTILADPPWNEKGAGKIKRGADKHYNLMKTDEIIQLLKDLEIFNPDPDGCHFYLWTTNNYLPDGLKLIEELGFRYITNLCWYKKEKFGLGQYFRGKHELCLFSVFKKESPLDTMTNNTPTAFRASRGKHSEKPAKMYEIIEKNSPPPRLELFAREKRDGWDAWGREVPNTRQIRLRG